MLPPFNELGLLPPSANNAPYGCSVDEMETRFVTDLGSPSWRQELFDGWLLVRDGVAELMTGTTWWIWGCFVSSHPDPLFGPAESLNTVAILPASALPAEPMRSVLLDFLRSAETQHRVDVGIVFDFDNEDTRRLDTVDMLEFTWRPRACVNIADHSTKELVPAGFIEVLS